MSENPNLLRRIWSALPFTGEPRPRINVIELEGAIGAAAPGHRALTLRRLEKAIEAAFKPSDLAAVALAINSPGGSAVQSRLIFRAIRRLSVEKKIPVLAFIEDVGASGGYILALAADEIYADESSVVGSIGVIAGGFGFQEAIARLGVERRLHIAGENKAMLDPFQPENPEDIARLKTILNDMHAQFIALVRERRPGKIAEDPDVFSGAYWTAPKAKDLGLIDGVAHLGDFLRARYGKDVRIKRLSPDAGSLVRRLMAGGETRAFPWMDADAFLAAAERRALWARFGL
jgi:serine protease SohB